MKMKKTAASRRARLLRERLEAELSSMRPEPLHLKMRAMLRRALPLTGYLLVATAAAANLRCIDLGHFSQVGCHGPIDKRDGGFKCKGLIVSVTVILVPC